jgi:hypothetical protein
MNRKRKWAGRGGLSLTRAIKVLTEDNQAKRSPGLYLERVICSRIAGRIMPASFTYSEKDKPELSLSLMAFSRKKCCQGRVTAHEVIRSCAIKSRSDSRAFRLKFGRQITLWFVSTNWPLRPFSRDGRARTSNSPGRSSTGGTHRPRMYLPVRCMSPITIIVPQRFT